MSLVSTLTIVLMASFRGEAEHKHRMSLLSTPAGCATILENRQNAPRRVQMFGGTPMERTSMRFARLGAVGAEIPVVLDGDRSVRPASRPHDVDGGFLAAGGIDRARPRSRRETLDEVADAAALRVGAPIARPSAVYCIGMNYAAHAAESGAAPPEHLVMFMKSPNTVVGPYDDVAIPRGSDQDRLGGRARRRHRPPRPLPRVAGRGPRAHRRLRRSPTTSRSATSSSTRPAASGARARARRASARSARGSSPPTRSMSADARPASWVNGEPRQDSTTARHDLRRRPHRLAPQPVPGPRARATSSYTGTPEGVALSGRFPYLSRATSSRSRSRASAASASTFVQAWPKRTRAHDQRASTGLVAIVTGGASGIGAAIAERSPSGGARVAVLDLNIGRRDPTRLRGRRRRRATTLACAPPSSAVAPIRRHRHPGQQRRHRRPGHRRGQRRRGVARACSTSTSSASCASAAPPCPHLRRPPPRRSSTPARSRPPRAAAARAVQRDQGRRARRSPGRWPPTTCARRPRQLREPRHRGHPVGRPAARRGATTRRPSAPPSRPGSRTAGWSSADEVADAVAYLASPPLRLDDRHRARRRRRHAGPAAAARHVTVARVAVARTRRRDRAGFVDNVRCIVRCTPCTGPGPGDGPIA